MTGMTIGATPAEMSVIDEMAEMDAYMREFMTTAARYVFSGSVRPDTSKTRDDRVSGK